jgi:hypothetical protein
VPDYARNAHGNIAEQNRQYGPFRGADSTKPPLPNCQGLRPKVSQLSDEDRKALVTWVLSGGK